MRNIHISLLRVFEFLEIRLWESRIVLMGIKIVTFTPTSKTKQDFGSEAELGSICVLRHGENHQESCCSYICFLKKCFKS